jgi:hypothetical protein
MEHTHRSKTRRFLALAEPQQQAALVQYAFQRRDLKNFTCPLLDCGWSPPDIPNSGFRRRLIYEHHLCHAVEFDLRAPGSATVTLRTRDIEAYLYAAQRANRGTTGEVRRSTAGRPGRDDTSILDRISNHRDGSIKGTIVSIRSVNEYIEASVLRSKKRQGNRRADLQAGAFYRDWIDLSQV